MQTDTSGKSGRHRLGYPAFDEITEESPHDQVGINLRFHPLGRRPAGGLGANQAVREKIHLKAR